MLPLATWLWRQPPPRKPRWRRPQPPSPHHRPRRCHPHAAPCSALALRCHREPRPCVAPAASPAPVAALALPPPVRLAALGAVAVPALDAAAVMVVRRRVVLGPDGPVAVAVAAAVAASRQAGGGEPVPPFADPRASSVATAAAGRGPGSMMVAAAWAAWHIVRWDGGGLGRPLRHSSMATVARLQPRHSCHPSSGEPTSQRQSHIRTSPPHRHTASLAA